MTIRDQLLQANEDDVRQALEETASHGFPQDEADLLRFFRVMVDVVTGESQTPTP
jgi:hypothetical protein